MEKTPRQNKVKEALGRIYDHHPPYFREYLRRFQEDPTSRVFAPLAEAYRRMGRVEDAIEVCREGLEHHSDFHGGRVTLAKCYIDKKMFDEARVELERVVQFVPENLLAQRLLGDAYLALKHKPSALHCYKMALLLSPADVMLAERVHNLEKDLQGGNPDSDFLTDVLKQEPKGDAPLKSSIEDEFQVIDKVTLDASDDLPPLWDLQNKKQPAAALPAEGVDVETLLQSHEPVLEDLNQTDADEGFKVEHVSQIFDEAQAAKGSEITTETLGDLYFSQGQYDRSLRIFEKLAEKNPTTDLVKKINACRARLGVDRESLVRNRQITALKSLLRTVQTEPNRR